MTTFRSVAELKKAYSAKAKAIEKATPRMLASYTKGLSRKIRSKAPYATGETKSGIKWNMISDRRSRIISEVSPKGATGFRQNMWANRTPPHDAPRMVWNANQKTMYGNGTHIITGTPGFFSVTVFKNRNRFFKSYSRNFRSALKVV